MNKDDSRLPLRTTLLSREADDYQVKHCNDPRPNLNLETIARYREIYRQKVAREESPLWAKLQAWVRNAGPNTRSR
jgi:hypothetical protein